MQLKAVTLLGILFYYAVPCLRLLSIISKESPWYLFAKFVSITSNSDSFCNNTFQLSQTKMKTNREVSLRYIFLICNLTAINQNFNNQT